MLLLAWVVFTCALIGLRVAGNLRCQLSAPGLRQKRPSAATSIPNLIIRTVLLARRAEGALRRSTPACSIVAAEEFEVPSTVRHSPIGIFRDDRGDMWNANIGASWCSDLATVVNGARIS